MLKDNGYSLVEMTVVMLLLVVFGLGIFMLAATTTTTYSTLVDEKSSTEHLRIASSFLTTKIRQNDRAEGIFVLKEYEDFGDVLLIEEAFGDDIYITWIYVSEGTLREATIPIDMYPTDDLSFEIASIDTFSLSYDEKWVSFDLTKSDKFLNDVTVSIKSTVSVYE